MTIRTVSVFGASGRQGQAQLRELIAQGYWPRAVSRHKEIFQSAGLDGIGIMAGDYADTASLDRVLGKADALFFQPPQVERPDRILMFARHVGEAAVRARVKRVVVNSTMWAPDAPCGQPMYDLVLMIENIFSDLGLPLVVFRPTVFMDNWLTAFAKPMLVKEHKYRYPHKPNLRYSPISLDDVAKFMVAALGDDSLVGQRLRIAGPETLTPPQVAEVLSRAMRVKIAYEYQSPQEFGSYLYDLFGAATGADRETYVGYFSDFYTFNNEAPQQPFYFDVAALLKRIPVKLETFDQWARRQDWTTLDEAVGSVSR
jgi:uncharacterized protein YbjT (DUF2867 family)